MFKRNVILDANDPRIGHASLTCENNADLADRLTSWGHDLSHLDDLLAAAVEHGFVVPTWAARDVRPCPRCTLVATSNAWAAAA
jgi:hypothetical protein